MGRYLKAGVGVELGKKFSIYNVVKNQPHDNVESGYNSNYKIIQDMIILSNNSGIPCQLQWDNKHYYTSIV